MSLQFTTGINPSQQQSPENNTRCNNDDASLDTTEKKILSQQQLAVAVLQPQASEGSRHKDAQQESAPRGLERGEEALVTCGDIYTGALG